MITFCSDFGTTDPYAAIVKGVVLSINPKAEIIDLSHDLVPHDIRRAVFFVGSACPVFPANAVHLSVVDPGVGSNRKPIFVVTERHFYVGPDNGLFSLIWQNSTKRKAYWIRNGKYFFRTPSRTFDARDLFGPVAAYLSLGVAPEEFGPLLSSIQTVRFPRPVQAASGRVWRFSGEIIYIDQFGNLVTNFPCGIAQMGNIAVKIGNHKMRGLAPSYAAIPRGQTAPVLGSLGYLELAGNAVSAQRLLKAKIGTKVELMLL